MVVESADPEVSRGHTMYHRYSSGSISYAEFRHLGKTGSLGKYSLHFHRVGDTMRGSSVVGASIWDSGNRWLTIHGTNSLVVRDCVGFRSVGHGFFLEDGTEVENILDGNLAVQALQGSPLSGRCSRSTETRGLASGGQTASTRSCAMSPSSATSMVFAMKHRWPRASTERLRSADSDGVRRAGRYPDIAVPSLRGQRGTRPAAVWVQPGWWSGRGRKGEWAMRGRTSVTRS